MDLTKVVKMLGPTLPPRVAERLMAPGEIIAVPQSEWRMVVTPRLALEAAASRAHELGLEPIILGDSIEGESATIGAQMAAVARARVERPTVLLSGGETTVTFADVQPARGGPNTEFLLSLVNALDGRPNIWALAADTDGEDGASRAAGAFAAPDTILRARAAGLDPLASVLSHDCAALFATLGDLLETGPTRTNVNDFRAILVLPERETT
jgi:hydroxypyruvate reductase